MSPASYRTAPPRVARTTLPFGEQEAKSRGRDLCLGAVIRSRTQAKGRPRLLSEARDRPVTVSVLAARRRSRRGRRGRRRGRGSRGDNLCLGIYGLLQRCVQLLLLVSIGREVTLGQSLLPRFDRCIGFRQCSLQ